MNTKDNDFVAGIQSWHNQIIGLKTVKALRANWFDADFFSNCSDATQKVMSYVKKGATVGFGGSQTIKQLGIPDLIKESGGRILDHNAAGISTEDKIKIMRQQQICDIFICSSNAISMDGALFNIDGNGNRLSAMIFGPKKVIILAGINKICQDEESAWERLKNSAAPMNMKRLNRPNPCTETGNCMDCDLPTRGCNAYLVLRKKPALVDMSVFIIDQTLGF